MYIISSCLAGENCKYNGGNNCTEWVLNLMKKNDCLLVCPEKAGGLKVPRPPAEIIDGRVIDEAGNDVTESFVRGVEITLQDIESAVENGHKIECAILKANSPSCGYGNIYDGTFSGVKVEGDGVLGAALRDKDILVVDENNRKLRREYG